MTKEQATEIRRIMGNAEEVQHDLAPIQEQLQEEWDSMTGGQQDDNIDLQQLLLEVEELNFKLEYGIRDIMARLDDVSGGLTE